MQFLQYPSLNKFFLHLQATECVISSIKRNYKLKGIAFFRNCGTGMKMFLLGVISHLTFELSLCWFLASCVLLPYDMLTQVFFSYRLKLLSPHIRMFIILSLVFSLSSFCFVWLSVTAKHSYISQICPSRLAH